MNKKKIQGAIRDTSITACPRRLHRFVVRPIISRLRRKIPNTGLYFLKLFHRAGILGEFHLIHAKSYLEWRSRATRYPHHRRLAMNTLAAEHGVFRQLDFDRHHFPHARLLARWTLGA